MRVIVITGASGGIAEQVIRRLPETDGLVLIGRDKEKLEQRYRHLTNKTCLACDITDEKAIETVVERIYQQYGRVDVLINNAGFGEFKPYDAYVSSTIKEMFAVNTLAPITFSRLIAKKMTEQGSGHIVTIASMAGLIASANSSIYSATKFAVIGFSNALRLELADQNVYVTTVNPGPVATTFFDRADPSGNYLEKIKVFTLRPETVAKKIVASLGKNKRDINLPFSLVLAHRFYTLCPKIGDFLASRVFRYK